MFTEYGTIQKQALVYTMDLQQGIANLAEIMKFRNKNADIIESDILLDLDAAIFFSDSDNLCENS